jgi:hypothetical protein
MTRSKRGFGSLRMAMAGMIVAGSAALVGCGGSGDSATSAAAASAGAASSAASDSLQGTAITTATVGTVYSFQPQPPASSSSAAALTYSISNKPAWAAFNSATGQLSGTPTAADVGSYANIQISATSGTATVASLPAFTLTVTPGAAGASSVSLNWVAPTENSNGTPLTNLQGYKIHYGTQSQNYTGEIAVSNPTLTTYLVNNLPAGKYYFAVTAYNSDGVESSPSDEISATFN